MQIVQAIKLGVGELSDGKEQILELLHFFESVYRDQRVAFWLDDQVYLANLSLIWKNLLASLLILCSWIVLLQKKNESTMFTSTLLLLTAGVHIKV